MVLGFDLEGRYIWRSDDCLVGVSVERNLLSWIGFFTAIGHKDNCSSTLTPVIISIGYRFGSNTKKKCLLCDVVYRWPDNDCQRSGSHRFKGNRSHPNHGMRSLIHRWPDVDHCRHSHRLIRQHSHNKNFFITSIISIWIKYSEELFVFESIVYRWPTIIVTSSSSHRFNGSFATQSWVAITHPKITTSITADIVKDSTDTVSIQAILHNIYKYKTSTTGLREEDSYWRNHCV